MLSGTYYPFGPAEWGMQRYAPGIRTPRLGAFAAAVLVAAVTLTSPPVATARSPLTAAARPATAPVTAAASPAASPSDDNRGLVSIAPARVLDTRPDYGGTGSLAAFGRVGVNVTNALGVAPSAVAAVALNV